MLTESSQFGFVFLSNVTADVSTRRTCQVYRVILLLFYLLRFSQMLLNRLLFIVQLDNDPKQTTKATQESLKDKEKKLDILQRPSQSPDLNPTERAFQLPNTKLNAEQPTNRQQLKVATSIYSQLLKMEEFLNRQCNTFAKSFELKLKVGIS